jgi:hypothetical protein
MSAETLCTGGAEAFRKFYSAGSMTQRFPWRGRCNRSQRLLYNAFMRKASQSEVNIVAEPTAEPNLAPMPAILPIKCEWRAAMLEAAGRSEHAAS